MVCMQKKYYFAIVIFSLTGICPAGENVCLYFPMDNGRSWHYLQKDGSSELTAVIDDTVTINGRLYYRYAPYGSYDGEGYYFLRPADNMVWALNAGDSSEFVLFDFTAEPAESWPVPAALSPLFGQCDWGNMITLAARNDTISTTDRIFYQCFRFEHTGHPCYDAGIQTTWFARDFGMVRYTQITIAGPYDWDLVTGKPDTVMIAGSYSIVGNPCLTIPCLPGVVSAVESEGIIFILTSNDHMYSDGNFTWNDYTPVDGDSVVVRGIVTHRTDINNDSYLTVEVTGFAPYSPALVRTEMTVMSERGTRLLQNFPNPFNPVTTIAYQTTTAGILDVSIYNILGQKIETVVSGEKAAGTHTVKWNAEKFPGGIYYYVLRSGKHYDVKQMVLLR